MEDCRRNLEAHAAGGTERARDLSSNQRLVNPEAGLKNNLRRVPMVHALHARLPLGSCGQAHPELRPKNQLTLQYCLFKEKTEFNLEILNQSQI